MKPDSNQQRKALSPPETDNTLITEELIDRCVEASRLSERKRMILPLHKSEDANLHRMLNGLQPGSYIQPHRHYFPPKAESVIVLRGEIIVFNFDNEGKIEETHRLTAGGAQIGIDSEPGVFHTFIATAKNTVIFEVKPGPYNQADDKDFAPWAPAEGEDGVEDYLQMLYEEGKKLA